MTTNGFNGQASSTGGFDIVCFSHLRWDFVYQRPQHLLSRFAKLGRVFVIEEPMFHDGADRLDLSPREDGLFVAVPHLQHGTEAGEIEDRLRILLDSLVSEQEITNFVSWYYTPMMLGWSEHLEPLAVVFDSMDELSAFKGAPPELLDLESRLFAKADLVFTGGHSLYESKRHRHDAIYPFPSSIDAAHFAQALAVENDPPDQAEIAPPRVGFFGVIDERCDIELLANIADSKPEWQFIMIGPVVKIDEADLPRNQNIHYLGGKSYQELPLYLAGWDVAMMPFAMNESTRFISPTKTPEYLAAGRPVVSTPIRDVVNPYGDNGLVYIAETPEEFVEAIQKALNEEGSERRDRANEYIAGISWDKTFQAMAKLIEGAIKEKRRSAAA